MPTPPVSREEPLRFVTIPDPNTAIGLAVRLMLDKAAYERLPFNEWARVLNGQVLRGHYGFVVATSAEGSDEVLGFMGWALTDERKAHAWATGTSTLAYADCLAGDAVIFNIWIAPQRRVHRYLVDTARRLFVDKDVLYWRRLYEDGSIRIVRVPVNRFVPAHVARRDGPGRA